MFNPSKREERTETPRMTPNSHAPAATVIARGVRVEGDFTAQGDVTIEGEVSGKVAAQGTLHIGAEAKLKAEVAADDAVIAGTVEGTVTIKKRLELKSTARVMGDVTCETAMIEAGAVLNGKVAIGGSPTAASKAG